MRVCMWCCIQAGRDEMKPRRIPHVNVHTLVLHRTQVRLVQEGTWKPEMTCAVPAADSDGRVNLQSRRVVVSCSVELIL
jgi:hypothetical protein